MSGLIGHETEYAGPPKEQVGEMRRPPDPRDAVVVWRDQAEYAVESLTKGSRVVAMGGLQQRTLTAEDGSARQVVEVADELRPSLRCRSGFASRGRGFESRHLHRPPQAPCSAEVPTAPHPAS